MIKLNIFKSLFQRKDSSYKVNKSSDLYNYLSSEYNHYYSKDIEGNILVYNNVTNLKLRDNYEYLNRVVSLSSPLYTYIEAEYRQNRPVIDFNGNYLLPNDMIKIRK